MKLWPQLGSGSRRLENNKISLWKIMKAYPFGWAFVILGVVLLKNATQKNFIFIL
jgi:hypothetical protein